MTDTSGSAVLDGNDDVRLAIDMIPGLVCTVLPNGDVDYWNQRWVQYTGLSLEASKSSGWRAAIHPDDLPVLIAAWESRLSAEVIGDGAEARVRRHDGEYRWFLFRSVSRHDSADQDTRWYGQITDIEGRKRAEALLACEKRLLEMVARGQALELTLDALCRFVEDECRGAICSILFVDSDRTYMKHGVAPSLPKTYTDMIDGWPIGPVEGPCAVAAYLGETVIVDDFLASCVPEDYVRVAVAHGLRACWSVPVFSRAGALLGTFAVYWRNPRSPTPQEQSLIDRFRNLTSIAIERTQDEAALRASEASLARAQRLSSTGSFSWRVVSNQMTWSDETYRICEVERSVTAAVELARDLIHPEDLDLVCRMFTGADTEVSFECRLLLPGGRLRFVKIEATSVREGGKVVEWVGALSDITARKRSEDALDRMRADLAQVSRVTTLGQLTASIAHEINQPLAGIVLNGNACLGWLGTEPPNLHEAREAAKRIVRDAGRADDVIRRLRSLFEGTSSTREPLGINDVVQEVIALTGGQLQQFGVTTRLELGPDLPPVTADRVQLQQLLLNLILNAAEAMREAPDRVRVLTITSELAPAFGIRVSVRDVGVGLDLETSGRIFDAFYTNKQGGLGMGLAISRSIVDSHGGQLWAQPNEGRGATFVFTLPLSGLESPP